jgi:hypothetical protein
MQLGKKEEHRKFLGVVLPPLMEILVVLGQDFDPCISSLFLLGQIDCFFILLHPK